MDLRIRLSHSDLTTEEAVSGIITWPLPPMLLLHSWVKVTGSIEVSVSNTADMITMKVSVGTIYLQTRSMVEDLKSGRYIGQTIPLTLITIETQGHRNQQEYRSGRAARLLGKRN